MNIANYFLFKLLYFFNFVCLLKLLHCSVFFFFYNTHSTTVALVIAAFKNIIFSFLAIYSKIPKYHLHFCS